METKTAFPHAVQALNEKYAQLIQLILERNKIDVTIVMVQQDISKCLTSSATFIAGEAQTTTGNPVQQAPVGNPVVPTGNGTSNGEAPKAPEATKQTQEVKEEAPAVAETPTQEPAPTQTPETTSAPVTTQESVPVTMDELRNKMAELAKAGKGQDAMTIVMGITNNPATANETERVQIMEALNAL